VLTSLVFYVVVYWLFVSFGIYCIYKLLHDGPRGEPKATGGVTGSRPLAIAARTKTIADTPAGSTT
jgi:cytochrome bd ubiquinol oxidase subunit I